MWVSAGARLEITHGAFCRSSDSFPGSLSLSLSLSLHPSPPSSGPHPLCDNHSSSSSQHGCSICRSPISQGKHPSRSHLNHASAPTLAAGGRWRQPSSSKKSSAKTCLRLPTRRRKFESIFRESRMLSLPISLILAHRLGWPRRAVSHVRLGSSAPLQLGYLSIRFDGVCCIG